MTQVFPSIFCLRLLLCLLFSSCSCEEKNKLLNKKIWGVTYWIFQIVFSYEKCVDLPPQLLSLAVFLYLTHPPFLHFYALFLLRLDNCSAAAAVNQTLYSVNCKSAVKFWRNSCWSLLFICRNWMYLIYGLLDGQKGCGCANLLRCIFWYFKDFKIINNESNCWLQD